MNSEIAHSLTAKKMRAIFDINVLFEFLDWVTWFASNFTICAGQFASWTPFLADFFPQNGA